MNTKEAMLLKVQQQPNEKYKLTVTKHLEKMIRKMCSELPNNEWSGTLFYEVEGSFEDNNLHIICKDFYLQDIGSAVFTEFQNDVTLAYYMCEHELYNCFTGILHSHNTMNTFFSGEDTSTLLKEGIDNNHFVSLIVNNAGTYSACITQKIITTYNVNAISSKYRTFDDIEKELVISDNCGFTKDKTVIQYYELDVNVEHVEFEKDYLHDRIAELRKSEKSYINNKGFKSPFVSSNTKDVSLTNVKSPSYPTLFQESEIQSKKENDITPLRNKVHDITTSPFGENLSDGIVHIEKETFDKYFAMIVTCDMFAGMKKSVDVNQWLSNIDKVYKKRFSTTAQFSEFAITFIEYLLSEVDEGNNENIILANDLFDAFTKYKESSKCESPYIEEYIDILSDYIIENDEEAYAKYYEIEEEDDTNTQDNQKEKINQDSLINDAFNQMNNE